MNIAQALALLAVAVASVVLFLVMRYPSMRRPQFQDGRAFSVGTSLACALGVFVVFVLIILAQP